LEQSISNLIYHADMSITAISLEAGFSSSQAYSNAFRRKFNISPRSFRAKNQWHISEFPKNQFLVSPEMVKLPEFETGLSNIWDVTIKKIPEMRLAYVRNRSAYYYPTLRTETSFKTLIKWAKARGLWVDNSVLIGICPDNPAVTPPHLCQYDIGLDVEHGVTEDETVNIQTVPETTVATVEVTGSLNQARAAWKWLISEWLPRSGMTKAGYDYFEAFQHDAIADDYSIGTGLICLPVSGLQAGIAKHPSNGQKTDKYGFTAK